MICQQTLLKIHQTTLLHFFRPLRPLSESAYQGQSQRHEPLQQQRPRLLQLTLVELRIRNQPQSFLNQLFSQIDMSNKRKR